MKKDAKKLLVGSVICSAGLIVSALAFTTATHGNMLYSNIKADDEYILVLNSGNAMNGNGEKTITSTTGGDVRFTYTNVSSSSGNHCAITSGGTIVNKDIIHSITSFQAEFTGTLQARIAYNTSTWGGYFDLTSNETKAFSSKPYFLEIKATSNVVLKQAKFTYTCEENPDATGTVEEKAYSIRFNQVSSDSGTELTSTVTTQISEGSDLVSSADSTKAYAGTSGLKLGSSKAPGSLSLNLDSTKVTEKIESITVEGVKYGTDSGNIIIEANDKDAKFAPTSSGSSGTLTFTSPVTLSELDISTSTKRAYIKGISLNYKGQSGDIGAPREEVGISATDENIHKYTTESIFDTDNGLSVFVEYSDSTHTSLAYGGTGYSYVVKDSNNQPIDTSKKFPSEGNYKLCLSYNGFETQINFVVSKFLKLVDITASMVKVNYNTADILSNYVADNLTVLANFDDGSTSTLTFAQFAAYDLEYALITPKGFNYDAGVAFGTAGTWTLKVSCPSDSTIFSSVELTVEAILVSEVSLDKTTLSLKPGDIAQLQATVSPANVTNDAVTWTSNNEDVATVDTAGLVTAVADGQATITATAADGSNVFGSCVVTVATPVTPADEGEFSLTSVSNLEVGQYVVFVGNNNTTKYAMGTQNSNNRAAVEITLTNGNVVRDSSSEFVAFQVKAGSKSNTLAFYDAAENGYLYAASSGSNYLRTQSTIDDNASFNSSLIAQGTNSRNNLRFNAGNNPPIFSCYSSGQSDVSIYAKDGSGSTPTPVTPTYPTSIAFSGASSSMTVNGTQQLNVVYTPNTATVKNVTFTSNNTSVATVSATGLITALKAGSAKITASAATAGDPVTAELNITVSDIAVTGVSVDPTSISIKAGKTATLVPTVSPSNAANKNVTYVSNNTSVATVTSAGVVTGVAAGNATITVTTVDGGFTATCAVTVTAGSSGASGSLTLEVSDMPSKYGTDTVTKSNISFSVASIGNSYVSGTMQWKKSIGTLTNTDPIDGLNDITLSTVSGKTFSGTIYSGSSVNPTGNSANISNGETYSFPANTSYFKIVAGSTGASYCGDITINYSTEPIDPTGITLSPSTLEISKGNSKSFTATYTPSNANQNKEITWTSSNTNVATVDDTGKVTVKSTATTNATSTITATLTNLPSIYATATVKAVEQQLDDHTVLMYICGADLESKSGFATGDIQEILKVSGQPDDVNIVIETGGASSWASTYGISSSNLERYHVKNKSLVKDASLTYASMGLASTLQSFLEWGLQTYPAERTGLILWNHGGGMRGVCYDEKKNDNSLLNSEVKTAVANATSGRSEKLEWIGYDACLMSVQDIAEFNSAYFNYQVSSEESEAGYGWDYDNWVDDLYAKKSTTTILKAICDTFITDNGGVNKSTGDQTLSYLNLSYMSAYKSAWETMAAALKNKLTSSNKSAFNTAIKNNVKHFADDDYDYFCLFDAKDFLNKLNSDSNFTSYKVDVSGVLSAFTNLVTYSTVQKGAGEAYGLCMYWPNNTQYSDVSTYYTTSQTNFTTWQSVCSTYGTHA